MPSLLNDENSDGFKPKALYNYIYYALISRYKNLLVKAAPEGSFAVCLRQEGTHSKTSFNRLQVITDPLKDSH